MIETDLIFGLLALIFLITLFVFLTLESSRSRKLDKIAKELDLNFVVYEKTSLVDNLRQDFPLFTRGKTDSISNLMHGRFQNVPVHLFDYEYFLTRNRKLPHKLTVLWLQLPALALPRFTVYPESWLNNLERAQINCDNLLLYGDDESWLSQLCGVIKDNSYLANLTVEGNKSNIILYAFSGSTDERTPPKKEHIVDLIDAGLYLHKQVHQVLAPK